MSEEERCFGCGGAGPFQRVEVAVGRVSGGLLEEQHHHHHTLYEPRPLCQNCVAERAEQQRRLGVALGGLFGVIATLLKRLLWVVLFFGAVAVALALWFFFGRSP